MVQSRNQCNFIYSAVQFHRSQSIWTRSQDEDEKTRRVSTVRERATSAKTTRYKWIAEQGTRRHETTGESDLRQLNTKRTKTVKARIRPIAGGYTTIDAAAASPPLRFPGTRRPVRSGRPWNYRASHRPRQCYALCRYGVLNSVSSLPFVCVSCVFACITHGTTLQKRSPRVTTPFIDEIFVPDDDGLTSSRLR